MSIGIAIDATELELLQRRLLSMSRVSFTSLLEGVGAVVESQTRRRIQDEKRGPDGGLWQGWSDAYAESKHGAGNHLPHPSDHYESQGHTLLSLSGALLDSIQGDVTFDELEVGSNLQYAKRQNEMRQFIGLSNDDNREVLGVINDFLDREMRLP